MRVEQAAKALTALRNALMGQFPGSNFAARTNEYFKEYNAWRRIKKIEYATAGTRTCPGCGIVKTKTRSWVLFYRWRLEGHALESKFGPQLIVGVCRSCARTKFVGVADQQDWEDIGRF